MTEAGKRMSPSFMEGTLVDTWTEEPIPEL